MTSFSWTDTWTDLKSLFFPRLDWIQVEVTSLCNAACIYCPNAVYRDRWSGRHLSLDTFEKLAPAFKHTRLVHLQGWGEPFLHPHFFDMVATAKQAGCRVGATTNGMLLDQETVARIIDSGLDMLAFSLAGADEFHDRARPGASLAKVLSAMELLRREKQKRKSLSPRVNIAYMLLRSGLESLSGLPQLLEGLGVDQVVISALDFLPSRGLSQETLWSADLKEYQELERRIKEVADRAAVGGLHVNCHLRSPSPGGRGCGENVRRALVVSASGAVTPCVFTNLPVTGATYLTTDGGECPYLPMSFGNLADLSLAAIWRRPAYVRFRGSFHPGTLSDSCRHCAKLQ